MNFTSCLAVEIDLRIENERQMRSDWIAQHVQKNGKSRLLPQCERYHRRVEIQNQQLLKRFTSGEQNHVWVRKMLHLSKRSELSITALNFSPNFEAENIDKYSQEPTRRRVYTKLPRL